MLEFAHSMFHLHYKREMPKADAASEKEWTTVMSEQEFVTVVDSRFRLEWSPTAPVTTCYNMLYCAFCLFAVVFLDSFARGDLARLRSVFNVFACQINTLQALKCCCFCKGIDINTISKNSYCVPMLLWCLWWEQEQSTGELVVNGNVGHGTKMRAQTQEPDIHRTVYPVHAVIFAPWPTRPCEEKLVFCSELTKSYFISCLGYFGQSVSLSLHPFSFSLSDLDKQCHTTLVALRSKHFKCICKVSSMSKLLTVLTVLLLLAK